ncbi:nuclear protein 96-domain-containing protein [Syncephalis pseudoplumigaleata]|uniref:Nuclear protein 96-domain-containing protein n=1 Tax=Syncephalis pseudoplumigaleata TaxID=1712513 RepID=A0A4P9Z1Y2_9FUNG|nr:nuclear protein 96-domain-containing protein [Syncephalis pseudoplumigaleata]|eukprot:RKP25440.1 nuclear protein 96-domain-containing protein [Syncephalis pseudoplumigaleata]
MEGDVDGDDVLSSSSASVSDSMSASSIATTSTVKQSSPPQLSPSPLAKKANESRSQGQSSYTTTKLGGNEQTRRSHAMRTSLFATTACRPDDTASLDFTQKSLFKRPTTLPASTRHVGTTSTPSSGQPASLLKRTMVSGPVDLTHSHAWSRQTRASFQQSVCAPSRPSTRKYARVRYDKSMTFARTDCLVDAGLSMGRSFRVGWGPGGLLVHGGQLVSMTSNETKRVDKDASMDAPGIIRLEHVPLVKGDKALEQKRHRLTLDIQRQHTRISIDEHGCPVAYLEKDLLFDVFTKHIRYAVTGLDTSVITKQEQLIWTLGQVLFDPIDLGDGTTAAANADSISSKQPYQNRIYQLKRKKALIHWLETAVESTTLAHVQRHLVEGNDTGAIFAFLTGLQVDKACELAIQQRDYRLATLLPQLGGDADFRADMDEQLKRWRDYDFEGKMSLDHRRIYELLRGNVGISAPSETEPVQEGEMGATRVQPRRAPPLNIVEGLDWRRVFGMHLIYDIYDDMPIVDAVMRYDAACAGQHNNGDGSGTRLAIDRTSVFYVAEPLPWYRSVTSIAPQQHVLAPSQKDILYHLLKIYVDPAYALEDALLPASYSPALADYRLSWQLHCVLTHVHELRDFVDRHDSGASLTANQLCQSLALQLEQLDLWEWSIYVLLFITDDYSRAKALYDMLARHVTLTANCSATVPLSQQEQFVVEQLHIPKAWVYRAKALRAKQQHDHLAEVNCWIEANEHRLAHQLTVQHLAPSYIIQGDHTALQELLLRMDQEQIENWSQGGGIYMTYIDEIYAMPKLLVALRRSDAQNTPMNNDDDVAVEVERARHRLTALLHELSRLPKTTRELNVAITEMISRISGFIQRLPASSMQCNAAWHSSRG